MGLSGPQYVPTGTDGWCDVTGTRDGFLMACAVPNGIVVVDSGLALVWRFLSIPEGWLLYVTIDDDGHTAIGQGHDTDTAYLVNRTRALAVGKCHGQDCVRLRKGRAYILRPPGDRYDVLDARTGAFLKAVACPPTSQGFADVTDADEVIFRDGHHTRTLYGRTLSRPHWNDDLVIGQQGSAGDRIEAFWTGAPRGITVLPGPAYEPHVARDPLDPLRYAICARTPKGAALALLSPPYPADEFFTDEPRPSFVYGFLGARNVWPRNDGGSVYDYQLLPDGRLASVKFGQPKSRAIFHRGTYKNRTGWFLGQDFTASESYLQHGYAFTNAFWLPDGWDGSPYDVEDNELVIFGPRGEVVHREWWPFTRRADWIPRLDFGGAIGVRGAWKIFRDSSKWKRQTDYEISYHTRDYGDTAFESASGWRVVWNAIGGIRVTPLPPLEPYPAPATPTEPTEPTEPEEPDVASKVFNIRSRPYGKYLCVTDEGKLELRDEPSAWEQFELVPVSNPVDPVTPEDPSRPR
jgi:hypothetical protein